MSHTPESHLAHDYAIVLPCDPENFTEFIANLLGKPQTIKKGFVGPFEITKDDVEGFHSLVTQRVSQQNDSTLLQFSVQVMYDDNSSVVLNSTEEFRHYNEIRQISSIGANLTWLFLVKFPGRNIPEKQQIEVSFKCGGSGFAIEEGGDDFLQTFPKLDRGGTVAFRIQHTARTWGADIEGLLSGHVETFIHKPNPVRAFMARNSGKVSMGACVVFFVGALSSSIISTQHFVHERLETVKSLNVLDPHDPTTNAKKVDYIINLMASGMWPRFFYYLAFYLLIMFVIAVLLGIWVEFAVDRRPPSFVTFSKYAEKRKERLTKKDRNAWLSFIASLTVGVATGVTGNILFAKFFS